MSPIVYICSPQASKRRIPLILPTTSPITTQIHRHPLLLLVSAGSLRPIPIVTRISLTPSSRLPPSPFVRRIYNRGYRYYTPPGPDVVSAPCRQLALGWWVYSRFGWRLGPRLGGLYRNLLVCTGESCLRCGMVDSSTSIRLCKAGNPRISREFGRSMP